MRYKPNKVLFALMQEPTKGSTQQSFLEKIAESVEQEFDLKNVKLENPDIDARHYVLNVPSGYEKKVINYLNKERVVQYAARVQEHSLPKR